MVMARLGEPRAQHMNFGHWTETDDQISSALGARGKNLHGPPRKRIRAALRERPRRTS